MPEVAATIRSAHPGDTRSVARVQVETQRSAYRGILSDQFLDAISIEGRTALWDELLQQPDQHLFVAETEKDGVVGFAGYGPERTGHPKYRGELYSVYVLAGFHGTGIGRRLVTAVAEWLLDHQYPAMLVWTLAANPSRGFYEHLGGRCVADRQIEIGGQLLDQVAYGWPDLTTLTDSSRKQTDSPAPPC